MNWVKQCADVFERTVYLCVDANAQLCVSLV